jgi:hypothetical protein
MMRAVTSPLLGAVDPALPQLPTGLDSSTRHSIGSAGAVLIAALIVLGCVLIWAVFFRKPSARRDGRMLVESGGSGRRRRRRQSKERPSNPTLSETGGLPPKGAGEVNPPNK